MIPESLELHSATDLQDRILDNLSLLMPTVSCSRSEVALRRMNCGLAIVDFLSEINQPHLFRAKKIASMAVRWYCRVVNFPLYDVGRVLGVQTAKSSTKVVSISWYVDGWKSMSLMLFSFLNSLTKAF